MLTQNVTRGHRPAFNFRILRGSFWDFYAIKYLASPEELFFDRSRGFNYDVDNMR